MINMIRGIYVASVGYIAELTLRFSCNARKHVLNVSFRPTTTSIEDQIDIADGHVGVFEQIALSHVVSATEVDRLLNLPADASWQRGITGLESADAGNYYWNVQDRLISVREKLTQIRASVRLAISVAKRQGYVEGLDPDPAELKAAHCFIDLVAYRCALTSERKTSNQVEAYRVLVELGAFNPMEIDQLCERSGYTFRNNDVKSEESCHVS